MNQKHHCHNVGLVVGMVLAIFHALWALMVLVIPQYLQSALDWIFGLHFIQPIIVLTPFNWGKALLLVVIAFIVGYIVGWFCSTLWFFLQKKF